MMKYRNHMAQRALCHKPSMIRFLDHHLTMGIMLQVLVVSCVGVPVGDSPPDGALAVDGETRMGSDDVAPDDERVGAVPEPIPVADVTAPTPVREPTIEPVDLIWLPGIGYAALADLYDLMQDRAEGSGSSLPYGYTYLELLCLDEGFSDSYCRSRFGDF